MSLYAIGDLQGCAREFDTLLERLGFDPGRDRLWLVGDLVNRGPESLRVLRRVMALGEAVTTVLGNHDLHLLAAAAGVRAPSASDTFHDVLAAEDAAALIDWLRLRPLLHWDRAARRVLVHAGLPPAWTVAEAAACAAEVESMLRGPDWRRSLHTMYGDSPQQWSAALGAEERRRYTINALTRMRYCDAEGRLDFTHSEAPGSQPGHLRPWFEAAARRAADVHIVFGHWATLGLLRADGLTALDSGCVWGGALTAVPLEPAGAPVTVSCAGYARPVAS